MAKECDIRIVQIGLNGLDGNIIIKENIEQDSEFIKEIRQRLCTIDNIVNICSCLSLYIPKDVVNLSLNIDHRVNVAHD